MNEITVQNKGRNLFLVVLGYLIIYAVFEITGAIVVDTVNPWNALTISVAVVASVVLVESVILKSGISQITAYLGLGKPSKSSILFSLLISLILFACYPLISVITGFKFVLPDSWLFLFTGVFVLHGIAEEVLYRAYLFRHLRAGRTFSKAAWLAVLFFSAAHIPVIISHGIYVGGTAVILAVVSSFPLSKLYERGNNTIWAPAIVHFAIDTVIPILAAGTMNQTSQSAVMLWMLAAMLTPYIAFLIPEPKQYSVSI